MATSADFGDPDTSPLPALFVPMAAHVLQNPGEHLCGSLTCEAVCIFIYMLIIIWEMELTGMEKRYQMKTSKVLDVFTIQH